MKNIKILHYRFVLLIVLVTIMSCNNQDVQSESMDSAPDGFIETEEAHNGDEIHLTTAQIEAIGLKTAKLSKIKTSGYFAANGVIDLPPSSIATLSAKAEGFVKELKNLVIGSYVKKGQVIATLEHPDFIFKQQEYFELESQQDWLQKEFERQKSLNDSNAGTLKAYQKAKMDLALCQSKKVGITHYLKYIGIDISTISNQNFQKYIYLKAPISGYISAISINQGMHVDPERVLMEIVNNHHVHLELNVFEKDIAKVKEGQKVSFTIPSYGDLQFEAEIHEIGRSLNEDNKAIVVHCHLIGTHPDFVQGIYTQAKIWNDAETVLALPEAAIVKEEHSTFIFQEESQNGEHRVFKMVNIRTGNRDGGLIEIIPIGELDESADFVIDGAYYLNAELYGEEGGGHSH